MRCSLTPLKRYFYRLLLLHLCLFIATGALLKRSALASGSESPTGTTNEVRRFAGWLTPDQTTIGVLLFLDPSGNYAVAFSPPLSRARMDGEGTNYGMQAWLLTTNGGAMYPIAHGLAWYKDIPAATFVFKRMAPMGALYAVAIKMGDRTQVLRIPSVVEGLSPAAQYQWDIIMSFPVQELDTFESGRLKGKRNARDRALLESAKHQLRELGVRVKWDRENGRYIIEG